MRTVMTFLALGLAVLPIAQDQARPQFRDKNGQFAMWFSENSFEFPDKETIDFTVSGNPVRGFSRGQNLEFSSKQLVGQLRKTKEGGMFLTKGTATGNAVVHVTDAEGESVLRSNVLTIVDNGETATVTLPGAFTATNSHQSEAGRRAMTLKGTRGTIVLKSLKLKDQNPLLSSEITGPVDVRVEQTDAKGKHTVYTLVGQRVTMRAEGTDKIILTMTGGVKLTSDESPTDGAGFFGEINANEATVVFDKDYEIKKVSTKGSPGSGTLKEKKDGS